MRRVLFLLGCVAALLCGTPNMAAAQCPSGQLDFDYDLGTLDDLLGAVLEDPDTGTNLWANGSPPVWQAIPGQVGPGFAGVDNDGNGINEDDHFDMLAAIINGNDAQVLGNINPATVSAIRNAFVANKTKVRTLQVTLNNIKINATALGFVNINETISVTTGQQACIPVPIAGDQCFDVPPLWGEGGILYDTDPQLEERLVNLAAGFMTIGDPAGEAYFQNVLGQVTLSALNALVPALLEDLKSAPAGGDKAVACNTIQAIDQDVSLTDPVQIEGNIRVEAIDICNAINVFIAKFSCSQGFNCQTAFLAASGNLNGAGTNNLTSYLNSTDRQDWLERESIINPPLQITQNPAGATVESGTPTTLAYEFTGGAAAASYAFRWETIDAGTFVATGTAASTEDLVFDYPLAGNTNLYSGVVCDGLWQRRTQPAQLTVNAGTFRITQQPQGATGLVPGTSFSLSVGVRGGGSLPNYQWQFDNGGGGGFVNVGGNSATLSFPSIDLPDTGQYRCIISGDTSLTSSTVAVQVVDSIRFQTQPASNAVYVGTAVAFEPVIIGIPVGTLNYEWLLDGDPISGEDGPTLSIAAAQLSDNGVYTLRIFDDTYDVTSNPATLEVALEPSFTRQPLGGGGFEGNSYTFTVEVSGGLTFLEYAWFFIPDGGGDPLSVGGNSDTLALSDLTPANQGSYYCEVTDLLQTIESNTVFLEIFPPFDIVGQPESAIKFVGEGHTFSVEIEGGTGTLQYQWFKGNTPVGSNNPSYTIDPLATTDSGSYRCVVNDDNGVNTSDIATLDVRQRLAITQQPTNVGVYLGQSVTLSINSSGGIGDIEYRWKRGSVTVGFGKNFLIPEATLATNGQYFCEVTDDFDLVRSNTITVTAVPEVSFTTQPQNAYRFVGDSATFTVVAKDGLGTLNYRWLKDNVELPYTGPILFFEKVFLADAGTYRCEVTDDLFTTSSEGAALYVFEEPDSAGVNVEATLTQEQVVPPTNSEAEGGAFGLLKPVVGSATGEFSLIMNLVHSVPGPTRIRMRKGVIGTNGPVLFAFNSPESPSTVNRNFSRTEAAEMLGGFYYVVVENGAFSDGAVRGQINANIPEPEGEVVDPCSNAVDGDLSSCSPHYNRIESANVSAACTASSQDAIHNNMPYNAIQFVWTGAVPFTAEVLGGGTTLSDTVLSLHCDPFVPTSPVANLIAFDDDDGTTLGLSGFKASDNINLTPGNTYWLVVSTFRGATTPVGGPSLDDQVVGDFGAYRVCLPTGAVVLEVVGGGGDECLAVEEGEGIVEGEGEGTPVEGEGEGVTPEGEGEGTPAEGEGEGAEGELPVYTADLDGDGILDLEELLRVIQLFNAGEYFCTDDLVSDDGYALADDGIAFGTPGCAYHASDYDPENLGQIVLSELLRVIQFFNLGGVQPCVGQSEDGFCIPVR